MVPLGGIILWQGSVATIPENYALCNGANGTPDLNGAFISGAGISQDPGETGGSDSHTHGFTSNVHSHLESSNVDVAGTGPESAWEAQEESSGEVVDGTTDAGSSLPPFHVLAYIMRIS